MGKKYYEVVFEGNADIIYGMLEGFLLGKGAKWEWFSSKENGIEAETFTEILKEWASLKSKLHHIVVEEDFSLALQNDLKSRNDLRFLDIKHVKSAVEIKDCSFKFTANAYAKKYGEEIKAILAALPAGVSIKNFNPVEEVDNSAKGVELYAPVHDYSFKGDGIIFGEAGAVIAFRKILNDHPLVQVSDIRLNFFK